MAKEATPKTYRATADGFDGKRYINAGEVFTTTAPKGSWMEPVGAEKDGEEAAQIAASQTERADPDYENLPVASLKALAADKGIPHDGLNKTELVGALRAASSGK